MEGYFTERPQHRPLQNILRLKLPVDHYRWDGFIAGSWRTDFDFLLASIDSVGEVANLISEIMYC